MTASRAQLLFSPWIVVGFLTLVAPATSRADTRQANSSVSIQPVAVTAPPLEKRLRSTASKGVRRFAWYVRRMQRNFWFVTKNWWIAIRAAGVFVFALVISMLDWRLWSRLRSQGGRLITTYVPLAALVYVRVLFDRHADRMGRLALLVAFVYTLVQEDLIPDRLLIAGMLDDAVAVVAASRWFMGRCSPAVFERHAQYAEAWWQRTVKIRSYRRALRARGDSSDQPVD